MVAFLVFVAAPVLYAGVRGRPLFRHLPQTALDAQNISCLFSNKPDGWVFFYFQVEREGARGWETLETEKIAPLRPFAYRSRLHRYLVAWSRQNGPGVRQMATWLLGRDREVYGDQPPIRRLRIAYGWQRSSVERPPQGRWQAPAWHQVPSQRRRIIATFDAAELTP